MSTKPYQTVLDDHFPRYFFAGFTDHPDDVDLLRATQAQVCLYEKVTWTLPGGADGLEKKGLRYGENPGQEAALYRAVNGHLVLAGIQFLGAGDSVIGGLTNESLIQFGKHPSKTNLTDVDSGLSILKYFHEEPCAVIIKHNNPCGVALGESLLDAYTKAWEADPIAPFGGVLVFNRAVDRETAEAVAEQYYEVICAPEYEDGTVDILARRKNLRIIRLRDIGRLHEDIGRRFVDFKSLSDGSVLPQWSYVPVVGNDQRVIRCYADFKAGVEIPKDVPVRETRDGKVVKTGETVSIQRAPTEQEMKDLWFAWMVETGVTSNSVLTAKNGATVSIGVGGQDRVMMAKQCVSKAYLSRQSLISIQKHGMQFDALALEVSKGIVPPHALDRIEEEAAKDNAGLKGAVAASDAFFPFRDGVDTLLAEGITAIVQPGGSLRDADAVQACNEHGAAMVFTAMRCFKH
ncbi:MAG: IMP cyclohydrolase [Candidatus Omnitrophica bacterium]|nr:IMP cyclohydrolase [Candidatus Omnitrophota bacterium]